MDTKISHADLVTETDRAVEKMVMEFVRSKYPTHRSVANGQYRRKEGNILFNDAGSTEGRKRFTRILIENGFYIRDFNQVA